jgi:hypothetical protein
MIIDTPINLLAGHDYILLAEGFDDAHAPVVLKGPGGETVVTDPSWPDANGVEFRAPYSATYFIEYDDATTDGWLEPDCRGDLTTLCHLSVNHTREGVFQWIRDIDTFAVRLNRAYTYTVSMTGHSYGDNTKTLRVIDNHGVILKKSFTYVEPPLTTLTFHPSQTGTYYIQGLCGADDYGFSYTLTLRIKR